MVKSLNSTPEDGEKRNFAEYDCKQTLIPTYKKEAAVNTRKGDVGELKILYKNKILIKMRLMTSKGKRY